MKCPLCNQMIDEGEDMTEHVKTHDDMNARLDLLFTQYGPAKAGEKRPGKSMW